MPLVQIRWTNDIHISIISKKERKNLLSTSSEVFNFILQSTHLAYQQQLKVLIQDFWMQGLGQASE